MFTQLSFVRPAVVHLPLAHQPSIELKCDALIVHNRRRAQVVKGEVCKTSTRGFESHRRLYALLSRANTASGGSIAFSHRRLYRKYE